MMNASKQTQHRRINRCVKLLNRLVPDWLDKISLETFHISSASECIFGQVFGDFEDGCNEVDKMMGKNFFAGTNSTPWNNCVKYGLTSLPHHNYSYKVLSNENNELWKDKIARLKLSKLREQEKELKQYLST